MQAKSSFQLWLNTSINQCSAHSHDHATEDTALHKKILNYWNHFIGYHLLSIIHKLAWDTLKCLRQLKSINLTTALLKSFIHWDESIRIKLHFVNSPFVALFTSLLWSFDLIIEVQVKLHCSFLKPSRKFKSGQKSRICCFLIFIYYKKKVICCFLIFIYYSPRVNHCATKIISRKTYR